MKLFLAVLLAMPLARAEPRNVSAEIAALRPGIVSAKVYAVTSDFTTRIPRTEESVARGCYYAVTGDDLGSLLDVLASGGLTEVAPNRYGVDARTVVYLTTRDRSIPLVLSREYSNAPMQGTYDHAVQVAARIGLGPALEDWEALHTLTSPTSESCTPLPLPKL